MGKYDASLQAVAQEVEHKLKSIPELADCQEKLLKLFQNCFNNTLETTVEVLDQDHSYVVTGDIPAMWLRDSTCQLRPYLIPAKSDPNIAKLIEGLVRQQMSYILLDPYANAFNKEANGNHWEEDITESSDWIWERKYEIDSLCFPVQMAYLLWKNTGDTGQFDKTCRDAVEKIIQVWRTEQDHEGKSPYRFIRPNCYYTDTLSREGKGALVKSDIGLTWSGFRPSDDACSYGYLVPANMFATVVLEYIAEIATEIWKDQDLADRATAFSQELRGAIQAHTTVDHYKYGEMYAYEVDGFGQYNLMDDANVPSLLSLSYLGYTSESDPLYQNTRNFILGDGNPYFYKGSVAQGIGSPHTPINYIWHISLAMEGLTGTQEDKIRILQIMAKTDGDTLFMHEGFQVDDPKQFTREWFSWANAMFCELLLDCCGMTVKRK